MIVAIKLKIKSVKLK